MAQSLWQVQLYNFVKELLHIALIKLLYLSSAQSEWLEILDKFLWVKYFLKFPGWDDRAYALKSKVYKV